MSLNHTRIYVVAESEDAFLKLSLAQDPSAGERACTLAGPLFIGEDICLDEETLPMFVNIIAEELGDKGLLIADTTNESVDPYTFFCYYLGDSVKSGYMTEEKALMCHETDIEDVMGWLAYGSFILSEHEQQRLDTIALPDIKSPLDEPYDLKEAFSDEYDYLVGLLNTYSTVSDAKKTAQALLIEYLGGDVCFLGPGQMYMPMFDDNEFEEFKKYAERDISHRFK